MGLFSFIKDIGAKLTGHHDVSADALKSQVAEHGFDANKVQIDVSGDQVKLSGTAATQEEAEKMILALGNNIGVAQVDTSGLTIQQPAQEAEMYTVQKGDTLWKIAEKHYGNGAKYPEIVAANSPPVTNPDMIQPGWVLRLPKVA